MFGTFITPAAMSVASIILLLAGGMAAAWLIFSGTFHDEVFVRTIIVLLGYVVGLLLVRILMETVMVVFRIEEHLRALRHGR